MAGIPLDWLITVNSTGVRDAFSLSKLPTLLITNIEDKPVRRWQSLYSADTAGKIYGYNSEAYMFINNYFGFTSKKASKADIIYTVNYNTIATPPTIIGSYAKNIQDLKIKGSFSLKINGISRDISVDLSSVVSYNDIATKLQEGINMAGYITGSKASVLHANNTLFNIELPELDSSNTATLDITTNASDYTYSIDNDSILSFDKGSKTITALSTGSTTITFTAKKEGLNGIKQVLTVEVAETSGAIINSIQKSDINITDAVFTVTTNASDYQVNINEEDKASITNQDGVYTITPLQTGVITLTFVFNFEEGDNYKYLFTIDITDTFINEVSSESEDLNIPDQTLEGFTQALVQFDTQSQGFVLKSGVAGATSLLSFFQPANKGVDIHGMFGLQETEATLIEGYDAFTTFDEVLQEIQKNNGGYYVIQPLFILDDDKRLSFAKFIHNSNDRFLGIINTQDAGVITREWGSDIKGYNGVMVEYTKDRSPLGFSAAIISAMDFSQLNGNINIAFNDASIFEEISVDTLEHLQNLENNLANSYLKFSQIGQSQVWYGMGNINGTKTNSANIYVANSYLKFSLQLSLANMLNSQTLIGLRGNDNETMVISYIETVLLSAVKAGIIIEGATLTTSEKQVAISTFGTLADAAITQLQRNGYFFKISDVNVEKQTLTINCAYIANKPVKRLIINNYILGA